VVKAGSAVPVKFSLHGFQGMDILAGAPQVVFVNCMTGPSDAIDECQHGWEQRPALRCD
jgi:hypothetical protein